MCVWSDAAVKVHTQDEGVGKGVCVTSPRCTKVTEKLKTWRRFSATSTQKRILLLFIV